MEEELIEYGLSEKEAKLYVLALKSGEVTANRLIELSGFARGTTYDVLSKLEKRGLVSSIIKRKTTYYKANDPDILIKALDEKKTNVSRIIPDLRAIQDKIVSDVNIEVYQGMAGVKKVLDDVLDNCKKVIVVGNEKDARRIIMHHPENFRQRRLEKGIRIKNLLEGSKTARSLKNDKYSQVRHLRDLDKSKDVLIIYNNTTVHMIMNEEITTIKINSKEYTESQMIIFERLWNISK